MITLKDPRDVTKSLNFVLVSQTMSETIYECMADVSGNLPAPLRPRIVFTTKRPDLKGNTSFVNLTSTTSRTKVRVEWPVQYTSSPAQGSVVVSDIKRLVSSREIYGPSFDSFMNSTPSKQDLRDVCDLSDQIFDSTSPIKALVYTSFQNATPLIA